MSLYSEFLKLEHGLRTVLVADALLRVEVLLWRAWYGRYFGDAITEQIRALISDLCDRSRYEIERECQVRGSVGGTTLEEAERALTLAIAYLIREGMDRGEMRGVLDFEIAYPEGGDVDLLLEDLE